MPTSVQITVASPTAAGGSSLLTGTLYVVPSSNAGLRIQFGGTGAFIPIGRNSRLPAPYQYGFAVEPDGNGVYAFTLPKPAETKSPDANLKWSVVLPDGQVFTGPAITNSGPVSLDDLQATYGWTQSEGLVITAPLQGMLARGTRTVTAQSTVAVLFAGGNMPSAIYQVLVRASADSVTGAVPEFDVPENLKTVSGFTITFSPGYTGTFDFLAMGG
jgi:hypothetical protein